MKKIAILVIAAISRPIYRHYIKCYWTELIRHLNLHKPHIDVFLLFENDTDLHDLADLEDHIIVDCRSDLDPLCDPEFQTSIIPGILSKTIHAFELLQDKYDIFFRTNLSSLIRVPYFDDFIQTEDNITYSGEFVWDDSLRAALLEYDRIGPDKSIKCLKELDAYEGNSFVSGSGYLLNAEEVKSLVRRKDEIRYDIVDDVSIGLMFPGARALPGFTVVADEYRSLTDIKCQIRASNAKHVRLENFTLDKAQALWGEIKHGQLWQVPASDHGAGQRYKIHFPLFDHNESQSNEVRLTHEGLRAHSRVSLVDDPQSADYLIFCQNHLVDHCPFHDHFRPIKDRFKDKVIMLDFDDDPHRIYDADDFRWKLYFKRSCVDRKNDPNRAVDFGQLPVLPTAYWVADDMVEPPSNLDAARSLAVSCLFDDNIIDEPVFKDKRGRLLKFAKSLEAKYDFPMQIGTVSECGPVGRSGINAHYKNCLFNSKIVLHANPDNWEGDARTWEAVSSGALVFVDRMVQPIKHPLVDGEHVIFFNVTNDGLAELEQKILYYLEHDREREKIGWQGREFVLAHHRSVNRINEILEELEDLNELEALAQLKRTELNTDPGLSARARELPDIVVTIATGYASIDQYRQFISTLRGTGAECPVFIGIYDGPEYEQVKQYLLENAVNYFIVPPITPGIKVVNGYRFEQYRQWLKNLEFRYALLMDFRDAYFQRDPFMDVERYMQDCDLYLMSEFKFLTVGNHPNGLNYRWVADAFGQPAADAIADEVVLNSGAILGSKDAMQRFLDEIAGVTAQQDFEFADQGTLNYLAHNGRLDHCGRIKITRAGRSIVNNCGFTEIDLLQKNRPFTRQEEQSFAFIPRSENGRLRLCRDSDGWVLDDDGKVSYVVHQYDRFMPELAGIVSRLSSYQHPDTVFVPARNPRYRAEKFVLYSKIQLASGTVNALIDKIKQLPVTKKPLLVVDKNFKHGFAFTYGTLHNDLLFESETFRRSFGNETTDIGEFDRFCAEWDYQPVFISENLLSPYHSVWIDPVFLKLNPG